MGFSTHEALIDATSVPVNSTANPADRRKHARTRVLKAAKVITPGGHSVFNCLVLDESEEGVFVDLGGVIPIPDAVTIQFASGAAFPAIRRWSAGTKCGFEFSGPQLISHETASRMNVVAEILTNHGISAACEALSRSEFFNNDELRKIAEDAHLAYIRLEMALRGEKII
jgi:hypothetical protein